MLTSILPCVVTAGLFGVASTTVAVAAPPERTSIVDVALAVNAETGEFSTLIAALVRVDEELGAGLIPLLDGNRQFTVFAPTDVAFDATAAVLEYNSGAEMVADLPAELLLAILTYHVSPGNRDSADVLDSTRVRTVSKGFVFPILVEGVPFLVDSDTLGLGSLDAQIIIPDVFADNGVIHVIDQVLIP
jgi:uncharacterized surface protein with fasciclin (FAS1) repeats